MSRNKKKNFLLFGATREYRDYFDNKMEIKKSKQLLLNGMHILV